MKKIDVIMFATKNLEVYTKLSIPTWKKYCEIHGYQFTHYHKPYFESLHLAWSKIRSVHNHLQESDADYVFMVDADTIPTSFEISIESILNEFMIGKKQILFQKDGSDRFNLVYLPHNVSTAIKLRKIVHPNAGIILMHNNNTVQDFFAEWLKRAETSPLANQPPRNQNVLNYEMLTQKKLDEIVGYLPTSLVNKYKGKLCIHFSSKSPEKVRDMMAPYFEKLVK